MRSPLRREEPTASPTSTRLINERGYLPLLAVLGAALVASLFAGVVFGSARIPAGTVWEVLTAHLSGDTAELDPIDDRIVWDFRVPRVALAALVGAGLAVTGVALQALVRNPLADPFILGATQGASLGAISMVVLGGALGSSLGVSGGAFLGAIVSLLVVFALAQRHGVLSPTRLVLAGVALAYLVQSATSYLQLTLESQAIGGILFWLLGSVGTATWSDLGLPALAILATTGFLALRAPALNALATGDDAAVGVGVDVDRLRRQLLLASSFVVATVVAVAGGVGFVGLMVPHVGRLLVGPDHRRLIPLTLLLGAVFLVVVDLVARTIDRPNELPLGIFTAALGAPFFLVLLRRSRAAL